MSREAPFTKEQRQKIIRDFCRRRNRDFDARLFEKEVREEGKKHPAWSWFEWNDDKASSEYRIWQARQFAVGLRISFKVETVGRDAPVKVREVVAPLLISPGGDRKSGGGYVLTDLSRPDHMGELCRQAGADLGRWLRRYEAAVAHAGIDVDEIGRFVKLLEQASPQKVAKKSPPSRAGTPRRRTVKERSGARRSQGRKAA